MAKRKTDLTGTRLAGAALYALLVTAATLPIMVWIAGLIIGPQALRERFIITLSRFGAFHGTAAIYLVMLTGFILLTLANFAIGPRKRYAWKWDLGPQLFNDKLSAREKLQVVLTSTWGRVWLGLGVMWLVLAALPN